MSEALTGRSANRGECSQLCRLPYDVETPEGRVLARRKHVLSLKDNDQSANLEALIDAGVSSFKIEGRLKDMAYVKNVTAFYREKIDEILRRRPELSRTSDGISTYSFAPSPDKVFNRGKTDYFIHGREFDAPYELAELESPKHAGKPVGRVERIEEKRLVVKALPGVSFANGDGLTYLAGDEEIRGISVNRAEPLKEKDLWALYLLQSPKKLEGLECGLELKRNRDHVFMKTMEGKTAERRIPIDLIFSTHEDSLDLMATDGTHCASASVALDLTAPSDPQKNIASLKANLAKLGDTLFYPKEIFVPDNLDVFVPASFANHLRRSAVDELLAMREASRVRTERAPWDDAVPYPEKFLAYKANIANSAARRFYLAHGSREMQPAFEIKPVEKADLMTCRHCIRAALKRCPKMLKAFPELLEMTPREAFRPEPLVLVNSSGERFEALFHCKADSCFMTITHADDPSGSRYAG